MSTRPTIEVVLLAAGASGRMGRPKQLIPFSGTTLVRHLAAEAVRSDASHVRVVVGASETAVREHIEGLNVTIVANESWVEGLASSIRAGVASVPETTDGVILMLCDMPAVSSAHLNTLIRASMERSKGIVASAYNGTIGVPALFMRRSFGALLELRGDAGAKRVLERNAGDLATVPLAGGGIDLDTEDDVRRHLHGLKSGA
jgi:molybdenum cofactor cytidylyltransferase